MELDRAPRPQSPLVPFGIRSPWRPPARGELPRGYTDHHGLYLLEWFVAGEPEPAGSITCANIGGHCRALVAGNSKARHRLEAWKAAALEAATLARTYIGQAEPLDEPIAVTIGFRMTRPKSATKRRLYANTKPDLDKLARAVIDSLKPAGIVVDDSRVAELHVAKRYALDGHAGAIISVRALGSDELLASRGTP